MLTIVRIMAKLRPFATDCFNEVRSGRIFASFDVSRLALSILPTLDETKKTKVSTVFLTAVRRGNDVRLTWDT
jgi:hypothetical protein